jgi:hypothetical protein
MSETDPFVGETYEDLDYRNPGRRVRVKRPLGHDTYTVEVIANPTNPNTVGRTSTLSAETLTERYRKVSH